MTYKNIMLTDKGLLALNAPEKHDKCNYRSYGDYCNPQTCNCSNDWKALEQAVEKGVYFKDNFNSFVWCPNELNKPYPIPDGYEVKIEEHPEHVQKYPSGNHKGIKELVKYAILVPKEKDTIK